MSLKDRFYAALELQGQARDAFLAELESEDAEAAKRVRELLFADDKANSRLGWEVTPGEQLRDSAPSGSFRPGDRVAGYQLGKQLGAGGFGIVFEAEQGAPVPRRVAIKVLRAGHESGPILARFQAERVALARMEHPNIARILDGGETADGWPYFVMDLVAGVEITHWCRNHQTSLAGRTRMFLQACRGVQHAHEKGIIHRDLKPGNVMVEVINGEPMVKIIDFGIAKAVEGHLLSDSLATRDGHLIGTPAYLSPEQLESRTDLDTRCDLYSLGTLLYELIVGAPPFGHDNPPMDRLLARIRDEQPLRPSLAVQNAEHAGAGMGVEESVPPDLDWIVLKCLEKEPARRYGSASELTADLERYLAGFAVSAAPPSTWYRLSRFTRRHRIAVGTATLLLISMIVGILGTTLGLAKASKANGELSDALASIQQTKDDLEVSLSETREANQASEQARSVALEQARLAELAEVAARREARVALEVLGFLTEDVLFAGKPSNRADTGIDLPIGVLLDVASERINLAAAAGGRFANEPVVEASVRGAIGSAYWVRGQHLSAEPHFVRALELFEQEVGFGDSRALSVAGRYADSLRNLGRLEESAALFDTILDYQDLLLEAGDVSSLALVKRLGALRAQQGRSDEACELLGAALDRARVSLGVDHQLTLDLMINLANASFGAGRHAEAEAHYREAIEAKERLYGVNDRAALGAKTNLASLLLGKGRTAEARQLLEEAVAGMRSVVGRGEELAVAILAMSELQRTEGEDAMEQESLREALEIAEDSLGVGSPLADRIRSRMR